jgi:hypothetical protein
MALGSGVLASALAEGQEKADADQVTVHPLKYVWHIDIKPGKREEFRHKFSDLSPFNKDLPEGCKFEAVYETIIGKGDEPPFQIWFQLPSLAAFEAAATKEGVRRFHEKLEDYIDQSFRPSNLIVRKIA